MLFSQHDVAQRMNEAFECVWEELRPAPRVSIDFGNGYSLERTLMGNVATLFCTPDGEVYDVLPSIMTAEAYKFEITSAASRFLDLPTNADLAAQHSERKAAIAASCQVRSMIPIPQSDALIASETELAYGKFLVESPIKIELVVAAEEAPAQDVLAAIKGKVELPIKKVLASERLTQADRVTLETDTFTARTRLLPQAMSLLSTMPLCAPEDLTPQLFRGVLHVDLEDPYLGLAPDVLGGRLGRSTPEDKEQD